MVVQGQQKRSGRPSVQAVLPDFEERAYHKPNQPSHEPIARGYGYGQFPWSRATRPSEVARSSGRRLQALEALADGGVGEAAERSGSVRFGEENVGA